MGKSASSASGRVGLTAKLPPQLGHRPASRVLTQSAQNVHSNVQMRASSAPFGRYLSHISQFGRISSIGHLGIAVVAALRPVNLVKHHDGVRTAEVPVTLHRG